MVSGTHGQTRMPGLEGKRVFVTGGSGGIGSATVLAFAASGATVTAAARNAKKLDAVVAAAPKGSTVHRVVLDLTSEESCRAAIKEAVLLMGGIDVVINCGGGGVDTDNDTTTYDSWAKMLHMQTTSVWVLAQEALPELKKSGRGAVVNVSSIAGSTPYRAEDKASYCAAKAAQDMVTRTLALQLAKDGVRVNGVVPAAIHTEGAENLAVELGQDVAAFLAYMGTAWHPLGRIGQPEEVAHAIAFLASDLASFMTGAIVPVDGGLLLTSWFNAEQQPQ